MKVHELRKGMTVYECERGMNIELEVVYDAYRDVSLRDKKDGYSCLARSSGGEMTLFQDKVVTHYGPRLYATPQYIGPCL